ncbi:proteasome regulatory particle base subunit rpn10 [Coemansia sp. RSA 2523]|nr:proteasome regulatory particle base subunit rpn10 [Coemansia sp. RSA 1591]KAJ1758304.1 proteasome regulatory particle base subunit rpn10 [Coemansia sp. RSA 1752]KAJ1777946.1 proteasome regulatory particle base subunit rpn10 [Coemansia sp. RSA 1824]KAJ1785167.1 proteasome regulatory particle base subunit rpn10 [Coemansia sp. RSA 1938]KAJ1789832.1 proteasome regulatory particle base subunit rpn10 [Coemansia sp. RSA 2167]KAJ1808276.1 proteasome regulatory particle base subunit rpn10 [Coemansia
MVLEATVIIIDNSEWSRNGDYMPTRYDAQVDAVRYLFNVKTSDNPENTVGVIANGGSSPQVLVSLTSDQGVLLRGMHELSVRGTSHFDIGIQIAQLVLKHRANKHQKQRIITFTTSPIETDEKSLVRLGKKLKKNGVSIDVISFGEHVANEQKLAAFVEAANNNDMSHLVTVPPGAHVLSEQIRASAIVGGTTGGEGGDFEFGVDPDMDPELALALRMSMQEEEERQRRDAASRPEAPSGAGQQDGDVMMEDVEDEEIREAIRMSLMDGGESSTGNAKNDDLVASLIGSLPGVDSNDPALQNALGPDSKKDEDKPKDKGKDN